MNESKIKRSNMGKLREASKMAMRYDVMLGLDVDQVMTLSLGDWQRDYKVKVFRTVYQVLGVFSRMPGETRAEVYQRLYEEAQFAGALLHAADPGEDE